MRRKQKFIIEAYNINDLVKKVEEFKVKRSELDNIHVENFRKYGIKCDSMGNFGFDMAEVEKVAIQFGETPKEFIRKRIVEKQVNPEDYGIKHLSNEEDNNYEQV